MATFEQFKAAFAATEGRPGCRNIIVRTKSGKRYWLHEDQMTYIEYGESGKTVYGTAIKPHVRAKFDVVFFDPANVVIEGPAD